jgi:hypothetical protein
LAKDWIGKLRVYLSSGNSYYAFCWISLWKDGSLLFGLFPKVSFTEYGSAVERSGRFTGHTKTLRAGNINIQDAKSPHVSFHPPTRIQHKSGIAQMRSGASYVDRWQLDWFPVKSAMHLLSAKTGCIASLERVLQLKQPYEIVNVPENVQYLEMKLLVYPREPVILHDPTSLTKLIGGCPHYIVCCYFYQCDPCVPELYMAAET